MYEKMFVIYVLCFDDKSEAIAKTNFGKYAWARVLRIPTTYILENVMYDTILKELSHEWENADYVGTIAYSAYDKMSEQDIDELEKFWKCTMALGFDVVPMCFGKEEWGSMVDFAEICHPGFKWLWTTWMEHLQMPPPPAKMKTWYYNYWVATPQRMKEYMTFFARAKGLLDTLDDSDFQKRLWSDAKYNKDITEELKKTFGCKYYPFHCFLLERLSSHYFGVSGAALYSYEALMDKTKARGITF